MALKEMKDVHEMIKNNPPLLARIFGESVHIITHNKKQNKSKAGLRPDFVYEGEATGDRLPLEVQLHRVNHSHISKSILYDIETTELSGKHTRTFVMTEHFTNSDIEKFKLLTKRGIFLNLIEYEVVDHVVIINNEPHSIKTIEITHIPYVNPIPIQPPIKVKVNMSPKYSEDGSIMEYRKTGTPITTSFTKGKSPVKKPLCDYFNNLVDGGRIPLDRIPLLRGNDKYLIHNQLCNKGYPVHLNKRPFGSPYEYKGLYLETAYNRNDMWGIIKSLSELFDPRLEYLPKELRVEFEQRFGERAHSVFEFADE